MASEIAAFEAELKEYREQLDTVRSTLQADPDNAELKTLETELQEVISLTETTIAELRPAPVEEQSQQPIATSTSSTTDKPKWSKENHPAFQPGYRKPRAAAAAEDTTTSQPPAAPVTYKVNDTVMAKWVSGDKAFYPARITSITGSSAAPIYTVTFKSYNNHETVRGHDIRPVANAAQKRRADGTPITTATTATATPPVAASPFAAPPSDAAAAATTPTTAHASGVISAGPNINPELAQQAKRSPSRVSDGPARPAKVPRKVKANKELEAGKSKWQEFAAKGKYGKSGGGGGAKKKDSMFRTGEGINARVGFTGSGQAMRKDQARTRHIYQVDEDEG